MSGSDIIVDGAPQERPQREGISRLDLNEGKGTGTCDITVRARQVTIETLQDSLNQHGVDTDIWMVDRWLTNDWSVTMGDRGTGGMGAQTYMNCQVKVWLKRREAEPIERMLERFIEDAKNHSPKYKKVKRSRAKRSKNLLEINMPDIHLSQLSWAPETLGDNYDTKMACDMVKAATEQVVERAMPFNPEKMLIVLGHDYFNVDNFQNMTAAGTLQDVDSRWPKTFTRGRRLAVEQIDYCRRHAPVDVLIVKGNHDPVTVYALGEALQAWYRNAKDVNIILEPAVRHYYHWGECLIGHSHGCKMTKSHIKELPLRMATDCRKMGWKESRYCEWHLGHLHHEESIDVGGVLIRFLASLAPLSAWAAGAGFNAQRCTDAFLWNKDQGNIATFKHVPERSME